MDNGITASHPINLPLSSTGLTLVRGKGLASILAALLLNDATSQVILVYEGELGVDYVVQKGGMADKLLKWILLASPRILLSRLMSDRYIVPDSLSKRLLYKLPVYGIPVILDKSVECSSCNSIHVNVCRGLPLPADLASSLELLEDGCIARDEPIVIELDSLTRIVITTRELDRGLEVVGAWGRPSHGSA